jgi:hypothetical protein
MKAFLALHLCGFQWVRFYIGGRWISDGSGFYGWVQWNEPEEIEAWDDLPNHYLKESWPKNVE